MVLNSYSKINLSLSVNNKLKSGLHEIQSYFCLINLSDKIQIRKTKKKKKKFFLKEQFIKKKKQKKKKTKFFLKDQLLDT